VRALQCALGKQHPVIGKNAYGDSPDVREAADQGRTVQRFELMQFRSVDEPLDDVADIVRRADIIGMISYSPAGRASAIAAAAIRRSYL